MKYLYEEIGCNANGHLTLDDVDVVELAQTYGTPCYVMSVHTIQKQCQMFLEMTKQCFSKDALVCYASKACCFKEMMRLVQSEGLCADVVSIGELYTSIQAGMDPARLFFHGSAKSQQDVETAIQYHVGYFVCDNVEELHRISKVATDAQIQQKILLRITPGIDPHTFAAVNTGEVDSKFGAAIETGQALALTKEALHCSGISLQGFHCHIGSQIFEESPFLEAITRMCDFMSEVQKETGFETKLLDLGGGFAVPYSLQQPPVDIPHILSMMGTILKQQCRIHFLPVPQVCIEPGRSIVAQAGITLYTVESMKEIPGFRLYVAVDGSMADNPRYALYQSLYTIYNASKANKEPTVTCSVAGSCCESGDLIAKDVTLPETTPGDILAVCTTGAYNYSMASNYNRRQKPPVVWIESKQPRVVVKRETLEDLLRNDIDG